MSTCRHDSGACDRLPKAAVAIASLFLLIWLLFGCPADGAACRHRVSHQPRPLPPQPVAIQAPVPVVAPPAPPPPPVTPPAIPAKAADPIPHGTVAVPPPAPPPQVPAARAVPGLAKTARIFTGVATVIGSRPAAEVAPERAFDRNSTTDIEDAPADAPGGPAVQVRFDTREGHEVRIIAYAITSSEFGDPARDPASWDLIGILPDGGERLLDRRTGEVFAQRTDRRVFTVEDVSVCRSFRLVLRAGDGGSVRLAEAEFIAPR
ncbi:MAG: hypothetical protein J0M02_04495 [Planctomycetes bacterium]|nr:hypothetical protein [Planctomycetota bacterium]